jgi:Domain of unknown function (DUF5666)
MGIAPFVFLEEGVMRIRTEIVVVAAVIALAACRGHEEITGGYGSVGVSGVVTMAVGMSNSSPMGVRVSVSGTGMSAVLGTDGRFSFYGVPEQAELVFMRDDVNARLRLTSSPAPLQIELNSNKASLGRRRAGPRPLMQVEGLITAVSATEITVHDSHNQDVTAKITTDTIIRKGDKTLQASDLKMGDQVHMDVNVSGTDKTAVRITLQNPDDGDDDKDGMTVTANGIVKTVGTSSLTVSTVPKGDIVVNVDDKTIIRKQGDKITLADIKVNDEVNCMGTRVDDKTMLARQIEVRGVSGRH